MRNKESTCPGLKKKKKASLLQGRLPTNYFPSSVQQYVSELELIFSNMLIAVHVGDQCHQLRTVLQGKSKFVTVSPTIQIFCPDTSVVIETCRHQR